MSKELLLVVDAVANEKGVPESVILEAIEAALASAAKKRYARAGRADARVDQSEGRQLRDLPSLGSGGRRRGDGIARSPGPPDGRRRRSEDVEVGDYIEEQIENPSSAASPRRPPSR
jgi:N utilization substance protein A